MTLNGQQRIIWILILVFTMIFGLSISSYGLDETDLALDLTENQVNTLKAYGLSNDEIRSLTVEELRNILREGTIVDTSYLNVPKVLESSVDEQLKEELIARLGINNLNSLLELSFTLEQVNNMTDKEIERIFASYASVEPSPMRAVDPQYIYVNSNQGYKPFHPDVPGTPSDMVFALSSTMDFAQYIFYNCSTSYLAWDYFLWGQLSSQGLGYHQGVDMYHTNGSGEDIRSAQDDLDVIGTDSDWGVVFLYDEYLDETYLYMHMKNYVGTGSIDKGDYIGEQHNTAPVTLGVHLHFQAQDGETPSDIYSYNDDYLLTRIPYGFMTWYL